MSLHIRKMIKIVEEIRSEMGRIPERPMEMIAVACVITNPWAGQGFVEDLKPKILEVAPPLGEEMVRVLLDEVGSGERIEAYGKAAIVGMNGDLEHASGIIHTLRFGNKYRDAVDGTAYLSFTNKRGAPGCCVQVPMMHKIDVGQRSHYLTMEFNVHDAPGPDELLVVLGAATTGRPFPRTGNRYQDIEEMGHDPEQGTTSSA